MKKQNNHVPDLISRKRRIRFQTLLSRIWTVFMAGGDDGAVEVLFFGLGSSNTGRNGDIGRDRLEKGLASQALERSLPGLTLR